MRLANVCAICNSTRWCGRPCRNAPGVDVLVGTAMEAIQNSPTFSPAQKAEAVNNVNNAGRQASWRAANPELNRQRAREGMRKLRAAKKDNDTA